MKGTFILLVALLFACTFAKKSCYDEDGHGECLSFVEETPEEIPEAVYDVISEAVEDMDPEEAADVAEEVAPEVIETIGEEIIDMVNEYIETGEVEPETPEEEMAVSIVTQLVEEEDFSEKELEKLAEDIDESEETEAVEVLADVVTEIIEDRRWIIPEDFDRDLDLIVDRPQNIIAWDGPIDFDDKELMAFLNSDILNYGDVMVAKEYESEEVEEEAPEPEVLINDVVEYVQDAVTDVIEVLIEGEELETDEQEQLAEDLGLTEMDGEELEEAAAEIEAGEGEIVDVIIETVGETITGEIIEAAADEDEGCETPMEEFIEQGVDVVLEEVPAEEIAEVAVEVAEMSGDEIEVIAEDDWEVYEEVGDELYAEMEETIEEIDEDVEATEVTEVIEDTITAVTDVVIEAIDAALEGEAEKEDVEVLENFDLDKLDDDELVEVMNEIEEGEGETYSDILTEIVATVEDEAYEVAEEEDESSESIIEDTIEGTLEEADTEITEVIDEIPEEELEGYFFECGYGDYEEDEYEYEDESDVTEVITDSVADTVAEVITDMLDGEEPETEGEQQLIETLGLDVLTEEGLEDVLVDIEEGNEGSAIMEGIETFVEENIDEEIDEAQDNEDEECEAPAEALLTEIIEDAEIEEIFEAGYEGPTDEFAGEVTETITEIATDLVNDMLEGEEPDTAAEIAIAEELGLDEMSEGELEVAAEELDEGEGELLEDIEVLIEDTIDEELDEALEGEDENKESPIEIIIETAMVEAEETDEVADILTDLAEIEELWDSDVVFENDSDHEEISDVEFEDVADDMAEVLEDKITEEFGEEAEPECTCDCE